MKYEFKIYETCLLSKCTTEFSKFSCVGALHHTGQGHQTAPRKIYPSGKIFMEYLS